jgi:hypothetical protein
MVIFTSRAQTGHLNAIIQKIALDLVKIRAGKITVVTA